MRSRFHFMIIQIGLRRFRAAQKGVKRAFEQVWLERPPNEVDRKENASQNV